MHAQYFYFYATTVNTSIGIYTPQIYLHGAQDFYNAIMKILFSFTNVMLMQESKYAKETNILCNARK